MKELDFLIYNTPDNNITSHLKNIFLDNELNENSTTEEISVVQQEGSRQVQRKQTKGRISRKDADKKAKLEYNEFNKTQKINSDFEKRLLEKGGDI